jgi:pimeloyl-ACP methyl ester carboxylesterase
VQGSIVLVGHSYGGAVITNAATGNANVKALVYVATFIPDAGETLIDLLKFPGSLIVVPPWKTIPARALVATQDNTIGTANTRFMAQRAAPSHTVEIASSHAVMLSHPEAVVNLINEAVRGT